MEKKKTSWIYRVICRLVRLFSPKMEFDGEKLPDGPCVVVGNHAQMYGPIAGELYFPESYYIWCAGEMMRWKEVHAYAYRDFWSFKPRWSRWFYRILSVLITPLSVCIFNNARTIPVYHDSRSIGTFRESLRRLQAGGGLLIFPEYNKKHNNILYDFQDRFIDLARFYYKKTGEELSFVPLYVAPKLAKLCLGEPIRFRADAPIAQERRRICEELMAAITALGCALPEHTVIPYRNIRRRDYPKNRPLEDYEHEKTDG